MKRTWERNYSAKKNESETKLMSWWWQLLLDHCNESVEERKWKFKISNEGSSSSLPFFILRHGSFYSFAHPIATFCFVTLETKLRCYPQPLSQAARRFLGGYKIIKNVKNDLKSCGGFAFITTRIQLHSCKRQCEKSKHNRRRWDWEGWMW